MKTWSTLNKIDKPKPKIHKMPKSDDRVKDIIIYRARDYSLSPMEGCLLTLEDMDIYITAEDRDNLYYEIINRFAAHP